MRRAILTFVAGVAVSLPVFAAADAAAHRELHQPDRQLVTAVGRAAVRGGDTLTARKEALADALRVAVEQAVGVYVKADSLMENFELVHDRVLSRATGFAILRKVNWERTVPEQGEYHVEVTAEVSAVPLVEALKELGLTRQWRVMVVVGERAHGGDGAADAVEAALVARLLKRGFYVVDREETERVRASQIARQAGERDLRAAAELGRRRGADIVLIGSVTAHEVSRETFHHVGLRAPLVSCRAEFEVRAVRADTAEIVSLDRADESALGSTARLASSRAAGYAGEALTESLLRDLMLLPAASTYRVQVEMGGFTRVSNARFFEDAVRGLPGVRSVTPQEYTGGVDFVEVEVEAGLYEDLGAALETDARLARFGIGIVSDNKNAIVGRARNG